MEVILVTLYLMGVHNTFIADVMNCSEMFFINVEDRIEMTK